MSDTATHRTMTHSPFLWMSKAARARATSAGGSIGLALYTALCEAESNAPPAAKSGFYASAHNLAALSGLSARTVERYLPILQTAKLILIESGKKPKALIEANRFRLLNVGSSSDTLADRSVNEINPVGGQKRNSSRREERISSEGKQNAAGVGAATGSAGSASQRKKRPSAVSSEAF
jgi:hypothetical protein